MTTLVEKFLHYVSFDTQSQQDVEAYPSTEKQLVLLKVLHDELIAMGAKDVTMDKYGYVFATIPANTEGKYKLGFIAHVDTSDAVSGKDVKPKIIKNYDGKDIPLSDGYVLAVKDFPELKTHVGKTLITTDGTTLLGADDKAGVAAIMQAAEILINNPDIKHGEIRIGFTPDEEVGRGTDFFDVAAFNCDGAYTLDGGRLGELEYENFNAAGVHVEAFGKSVHPGTAKGTMVNALLLLIELQALLPVFDNPMYTEGYEGFYHLNNMSGSVDSANSHYIIRDHDKNKFEMKKAYFMKCVAFLNDKYGFNALTATIKDSYYNMADVLGSGMHLVEAAAEAMRRAKIDPIIVPIRGGTDGARLSYEGLPCPNIFTGGYNFHGRYEYIPVEDFEKAVEVVLNIIDIYKDR
jgi:tripeptide aminopeptidase